LSKRYSAGTWRKLCHLAADNVSFEIATGKTLAMVGHSGSGKSTVARCVARLEKPDAGEIWMKDRDIVALAGRDLFPIRTEVQMIFQDPVTAMNPHMSAAEIIEEPLVVQRRQAFEKRRMRVTDLMNEVGLNAQWMNRKVGEFSGGQQQRIAIARALTLQPKLLILDEPFSGLDVSTQAQMANLLLDVQAAHGLTYLLISHDLTLVSQISDAVAVMHQGQIVEQGPAREIIARPVHEQTRCLVTAARAFRSALAEARLPS
jgi:ABC-type glutathione transport system ATPase component